MSNSPEPTLGALVGDLSREIPQLIRSEIRLAQAELTQKGKKAGIGIGMFGAAGVVALYGVGVLLACIVLALLGKRQVGQATPPAPERAIQGVKQDVATVKGARS